MAASAIESAATGDGLGELMDDFIIRIVELIKGNALFKKQLEGLESMLQSILPSIKRIDSINEEFNRPKEIEKLKDLIKEAEILVNKCSKIKYNYVKKSIYSKKLRNIEQSIHGYVTTFLQLHQSSDIKENLLNIRVLSKKMSTLSSGSSTSKSSASGCSSRHGGGGFGKCNGFGGLRVFSPPELKVKPIGLEIPLKELKEKLLKDDDYPQVIVVSAPAGCGKSTLVKALCQDSDVNDRYKDNICFVTVSKSPNLMVIIERLFQHLDRMMPDFINEEDALNQVENLLRSIVPDPVLLVLDDVWSTAELLIEKLSFPISGYKILVTSIFEFPQFGSSYKLQGLSAADSITLFRESAFLPDEDSYRPDQDTVDKMLQVCKGFPLAISVVGKSLRGNSASEWRKRVEECSKDASVIANFEVELLNCLQTSVNALNDKTAAMECYMDLGSFPEDHNIPAAALIDMWVEHHNLTEECAVANLYELSNRNLVDLVVTRKDASEDYGSIYAQQHDMLRELAIIQSNKESIQQRRRLFIDITKNKIPEWLVEQTQLSVTAKLLSICTDEMFSSRWYAMEVHEVEVLILNLQSKNYTLPTFVGGMGKLKVLIVTNHGFSPTELSNFQVVSSLINLRRIWFEKVTLSPLVLDSIQLEKLEKISLIKCNISPAFTKPTIWMPNVVEINIDNCNDLKKLPDGFCDLIHLRKLSIVNCYKLLVLPEDFGRLVNLEVLRLNSCVKLLELPETIGELHNLRILDMSGCLSIMKLPEQFGELKNLRKVYMIDCSSCELPSSISKLVNLKEVIADEETANSWEDFKASLPNLTIKVNKY